MSVEFGNNSTERREELLADAVGGEVICMLDAETVDARKHVVLSILSVVHGRSLLKENYG